MADNKVSFRVDEESPGEEEEEDNQELVAARKRDDIEEQVRVNTLHEEEAQVEEEEDEWLEIAVKCAVLYDEDSIPLRDEMSVVSLEGATECVVAMRAGRGLVFDEASSVKASAYSREVRLTMTTGKTTMVARVDATIPRGRDFWIDAYDPVATSDDKAVGRMCVRLRLRAPGVERRSELFENATRCADRLFDHFATGQEGMGRKDLRALVKATVAIGGNLMSLGGFERTGCWAACVSVPEEDLFMYVLHRHCIFRVCVPPVDGIVALSSWQSRSILVFVSLLWSFAANCLISAVILPDVDRILQVVVITFVDTFGVGVLTMLFYVAHTSFITRACAECYRRNIPGIITTVFSFALVVFLLASLTKDDLYLAAYSFFPIYATARVTEIFKLGTYWAMQIQLGSFPDRRDELEQEENMPLIPPPSV